MKKKVKIEAVPKYPKVVETFREMGDYEIRNWQSHGEPSAFNGWIRIKKYRITIEEIEEPKEVYAERIQKLWDECDNWHHWEPIRNSAKSIGYEITGERGSKKKPKV